MLDYREKYYYTTIDRDREEERGSQGVVNICLDSPQFELGYGNATANTNIT